MKEAADPLPGEGNPLQGGGIPRWRVTIATLDRVLLEEDGRRLLVVERAATYDPARNASTVRGKPYGGAVLILDEAALRREIGDFEYDSPRSRAEGDFRILVPPSAWEGVKQFCLRQLAAPGEAIIEMSPERELAEEFMDALKVRLEPGQVNYRDAGIVIENKPVITGNIYSPGVPTVRLYRIFEARILDEGLCAAVLENSRRYSDGDLEAMADADAARGGKGRANAVLALPLEAVGEAYYQTPPAERGRLVSVQGHIFHSSVLAVLEDVDAPEYERIKNTWDWDLRVHR
jgi:hypothetical protein